MATIPAKGLHSDQLDQYIQRDQPVDLAQLLRDGSSSTLPVEVPGAKDLFQVRETVELPRALLSEMERDGHEFGMMGLFPSINHLWVTLDANLYLFDYSGRTKDYLAYTELDQVIVSVGLLPAKRDVFVEDVKHVLVVATPVEIFLLAVVFQEGSISLLPTHLSVPSDNVNMMKIVGTDSGRIFMGGKDGHLYELEYQASEGWFRKKCNKINHTQRVLSGYVPAFMRFGGDDPILDAVVDNERNLLYTLTAKSSIQLFDLGVDGSKLIRVAHISDIRSSCLRLWYDSQPDASMFEVKSMAVVSPADSAVVHLVGVTASGIRLFFSTVPNRCHRKLSEEFAEGSDFREFGPSTLEVMHIRTPPSRDKHDRRNILGEYARIEALCYTQGICLMANTAADPPPEESDDARRLDGDNEDLLLICTVPSAPLNTYEYQERVGFLSLPPSRLAWCIEPAQPELFRSFSCSRELATQHAIPASEALCLTQEGVRRIVKSRPVDELYELLQASQGHETDELNSFFQHYGMEACAMCLIIICSQQTHLVRARVAGTPLPAKRSQEVVEWAEMAFFSYGGTPLYIERTQATRGGVGFHSRINLSFKFHGIALFVSRILAPIWKSPVLRFQDGSQYEYGEEVFNGEERLYPFVLSPAVSRWQLQQMQQLLFRLDQFRRHTTEYSSLSSSLDKNAQTPMTTPIAPRTHKTPSGTPHEARKQEEDALRNVFMIVKRSMEALSLLQLLCFPIVGDDYQQVMHLPKEVNKATEPLTFQNLVCSSNATTLDMTNSLISALIRFYSDQQNGIEGIAQRLNEQCPSYFSLSNMTLHRAVEELKQVTEASPATLPIFESTFQSLLPIAGQVDIQPVLDYYRHYQFFVGFVRLLLARAEQVDPTNLASQGARDDALSEEKFDQRMSCYGQIIDLYAETMTEEGRQAILHCTLAHTEDKLCHTAFFMWFLNQPADSHATQRLLSIHSPFLEDFLKEHDTKLLYRFYGSRGRHSDAARVACLLSEESQTIKERIEWLVDAIHCEKSSSSSGGAYAGGVDLHNLTEKLDVAKIQLQIYEYVAAMSGLEAHKKKEALSQLNRQLMSLTDLYKRFAAPLKLWESQLAIFHCAGHTEPRRVNKCWDHLIRDTANYEALSRTVRRLGKQFYPSEWVFPVEFLCQKLEAINQEQHGVEDPAYYWVVRTMIDVGVSFETLFEVYDALIASAIQANTTPLVYLVPMTFLIDRWVEERRNSGGFDQFIASKVSEALQRYEELLRGAATRGSTAKSVLSRLQYLQAQLSSEDPRRGTKGAVPKSPAPSSPASRPFTPLRTPASGRRLSAFPF